LGLVYQPLAGFFIMDNVHTKGNDVNRRPSMQFYPADWRKDPQLQMCRMSTQGIWMNLLCLMWEAEIEGEITGNLNELCRVVGCEETEFKKFYIDIKRHKFGDIVGGVTDSNTEVTITCRRMKKVFLERESGKVRQRRHRTRQRNEDVTPPSSTSSSSTPSTSKNKQVVFPENLQTEDFKTTWSAWQQYRKEKRQALTPSTVKSQLKKLSKTPEQAVAILKQSIEMGWLGLFPLKETGGSEAKTKLFPISGKTCSREDCGLPAVYKDSSGGYDHFFCSDHMPEKVKAKYA